jgi:lycopene cyclase domain-containing protein
MSLIFVFLLPALLVGYFVINRIPLVNLLTFIIGITLLGGIWDVWATKHGRRDTIWLCQFNFKNTLGIKLFNLPIEEFLFYIASSLYIIFIWEGIKYALETRNLLMYLLVPFAGVWSLLGIIIPYLQKAKGDKEAKRYERVLTMRDGLIEQEEIL